MRSVYGKECAKHPELAGRRFLPSQSCVGCTREYNRRRGQTIRDRVKELEARVAELEALLDDRTRTGT